MAAPGADVFYDGDYGYAKDGSDNVSLLASRIGSFSVQQASGPLQPKWGATSPSGRRGITFTAASSHMLVDPAAVLAGLYDGSQAYSALWVVKFNSLITQAVWGTGDSASSTDHLYEGMSVTTNNDRRSRQAPAGLAVALGGAHSTTIACVTSRFGGTAYDSWINGAAAIAAGSANRAPTSDQFILGARRISGAYDVPLNGEFYGLILSRSLWTTQERQALEAAAKAFWGTP